MNQIDRLLTAMQHLRDPENSCPQDKEQTFATIAPYAPEETYKVLGAITRGDFDDLRGELGDLLFQAVSCAQMVQEEGRFDFNDICAVISNRLERRHPHVFADNSAENSSGVLAHWEQIKTEKRVQEVQHSALDDTPRSLPVLVHAQKIQKRRVNVGFDQTTLGSVIDKVYEEIGEVMYETRQAVVDQTKLEGEVGDLLFIMVNLARHLGTKAEITLQKANEKFEHRFYGVECIATTRGLEIIGVDPETVEKVWQQVKRRGTDL